MATTGFQCSVSVEPIMFHCMLSGGRSGATKEIRSKHTEDMLVAFFLKASFWRNIQILGFCWISNKVNKLHCRQHLVIIWESCWCPKTNASGRPDCTYLRGSESFSWSQVSPNKGENVVGNSYWQALPHPDCSSRFILSFSFFFFFLRHSGDSSHETQGPCHKLNRDFAGFKFNAIISNISWCSTA